MRLFFGVPVDDVVRGRVAELQGRLKATGAKVKWVEPANFHFTLRFIGEVPDEDVDQVAAAAEGAWGETAPQDVSLRGVGTFPHLRRPRVVWVGVRQGGEVIEKLYEALNANLERALGLEPEGKPFTPHLTIGRVKVPRPDPALADGVAGMTEAEAGVFRPAAFVLYQSQLTRSGPIYRALKTYGACDDA